LLPKACCAQSTFVLYLLQVLWYLTNIYFFSFYSVAHKFRLHELSGCNLTKRTQNASIFQNVRYARPACNHSRRVFSEIFL
jgi:hypothetical protein